MTHFNPFPGLRPFDSTEDYLFFGRDGQSDELLRRLSRNRFLAVIGTSGSGKSSLVRAGLLPALYGGFMLNAGSTWRIAIFRPGTDPLGNLALALSESTVLGSGNGDLSGRAKLSETTLRRSSLGLVDLVTHARMPAQENLLIVVDQFEEIFRFKQNAKDERSEDDAAAFVKLLLEATRQTQIPVYVAITMRSDFLGDCAQFRDLPEAINDGQYLIPRMTRDQRRAAITGPIAVGGAEITPRLVNRLLNDVGDNPDQLPILQHALMRTWQRWEARAGQKAPIDFDHYEAVGGMADALSLHADKAYNELPDDRHKKIAERLFKCLTERGPDNREVRRPTKLKQICAIAEGTLQEVGEVIEAFRRPGRSFLMPPANVTLTTETLIDISHESLIRGWQRLKEWVEEEAQSARTYRRLADTAVLYDQGEAALWHDPNLRIALDWRKQNNPNEAWADRYDPNFTGAMRFLDNSKDKSEADIAAVALQQRREIRRARIFALVLAVAFIVSTALAVFAFTQRSSAKASASEANKARVAAEDQKKLAQQALAQKERAYQKLQDASQQIKKEKDRAEEQRRAAEAEAQRRRIAEQNASASARRAEEQTRFAKERLEETIKAKATALNVGVQMNRRDRSNNEALLGLVDRLLEAAPPGETLKWRIAKAQALSSLGKHAEVVNEYSKILAMEPGNPEALMNRGYAYTVVDDDNEAAKKAIQDLNAYLAMDQNSFLAYQNKSIALGQMGDYKGAESSIQKAIESFRRRSSESFYDKDVSRGIQSATGLLEIVADEPALLTALHYHLANLQAFQGQSQFIASLKQTDRERPQSVDAYLSALNWAWLHMKKRPEDYGGLVSQGALWERAGYPEEAKRSYKEFLGLYEKQPDKRYDNLAIWVNQELGKPLFRRVVEEKQDVRILGLKATAFEQIDRDYAERLWTQALELDSKNVDLWLHRASFRSRAGLRGSGADADKALSLAHDSPMAYYYRGLANRNSEDLRKVLDFDPLNLNALFNLSLMEESNPAEALNLIERAIKVGPQFAVLYYRKAVLQNKSDKREDHEAALKSIQKAIAIGSGEDISFYDERARTEVALKRDQTEVVVNLAAGYGEFAATRLKRGHVTEALSIYERSLDMLAGLASAQHDTKAQTQLAATMHQIATIFEGQAGSKAKAIEYLKQRFADRPELAFVLKNEIERLSNSP